MDLFALLKNEVTRCGLTFVEEFGALQMTMRSGQLKWRCLVTTSENDIVCCAQFPWQADESALKALNRLNCSLNTGCLFLLDGFVVLRCGAEISDPIMCGEIAALLIKRCSDEVCRLWNSVCRAAEGLDEF